MRKIIPKIAILMVEGTIVPEPATVLLLGLGTLGVRAG